MATLAVQESSRVFGGSLLLITANAAAGGGDVFPNDGKTTLKIVNGSGGSITVTVVGGSDPANGKVYADEAHIITSGATADIGPFQPDLYNNASGQVALTYSGVTSLTVGVVRRPGSPAARQ